MARLHRSYRLEESVVERVAAWAEEHKLSTTQAVERLLVAGMEAEGEDREAVESLKSQAEAWEEQKMLLGANLRDLRESVATLTGQLAEKDHQIARLHDAVEHAQVLEAAQVGRAIGGDVSQRESQGEAPRGIWGWLAKKVNGG